MAPEPVIFTLILHSPSESFRSQRSENSLSCVNTFLALLELLKRQYITVVQKNLFDDIDIVRNDDLDSVMAEITNNEFDGDEG